MILGRMLTVGAPPYTNAAGDFDGSSDYLSRGASLTGVVDGPVFTVSAWVYYSGTLGNVLLASNATSGAGVSVYFASDGKVRVQAGGTSGVQIQIRSVSTLTASQWNHISCCVDSRDSTKALMRINGTLDSPTLSQYDEGSSIDFTTGAFNLSATSTGGTKFSGRIADVWWAPVYADLSVSAVAEKFRTSGGDPADLGPYGTTPGLGRPPFYVRDYGDMILGRNRGTGGPMVVNGTIGSVSGPW